LRAALDPIEPSSAEVLGDLDPSPMCHTDGFVHIGALIHKTQKRVCHAASIHGSLGATPNQPPIVFDSRCNASKLHEFFTQHKFNTGEIDIYKRAEVNTVRSNAW
jgi:hypothetical protein